MPTISRIAFYEQLAGSGLNGWLVKGNSVAPALACQPIASGAFSYGGAVPAAVTGASVSPASLPFPGFSPPVTFAEVELTYTQSPNPIITQLQFFYSGGGGPGDFYDWVAQGSNITNGTYAITLGPTTFDLTLGWRSFEEKIDSSVIYKGFHRAQVRIGGGTPVELSLSRTLFAAVDDGTIANYAGGTNHVERPVYDYEATGTFDITTDAIELRLLNDHGESLDWVRLHLNPIASLTLSEDDGEVTADGGDSFFLGDMPGDYSFASADFSTVTQSGATYEKDLSDLEDGDSVSVTLTARTAYGCENTDTESVIVHPGGNIGTALDYAGTVHTAVKVGADVATYTFKSSVAARETRGLIEGAKNPSLWRRDALFYCAAQKTNDGTYHVWRSDNFMRSWEQITVATIWDGDDYSKAHTSGLLSGGAASVANKKSTDPVEIYFKASGDGIAWPGDADAVLVGTYDGTAKQFHVRQKSESRQFDIIVSNGIDAAWVSTKKGRAGSWVAL